VTVLLLADVTVNVKINVKINIFQINDFDNFDNYFDNYNNRLSFNNFDFDICY